MRPSRIVVFLLFMAYNASAAWAQYGLYGSPDMLRLPQPAAGQDSTAPQTYPGAANPSVPSAPAYQPATGGQPRLGGPATSADQVTPASYSQQYYLQPTATAAYPNQPPAQYSYSNPYASTPTGAAAAGGQPGAQPQADGQGANGCGANNSGTPYRPAVDGYERAATNGACADGAICWQPAGYCSWYASVSALVLDRSEARTLWTSYNPSNLTQQGGNSQFPLSCGWGGEVEFGRRFCWNCVPYAIDVTYWTTTDQTGSNTTAFAGGTVNTVLSTDYITFNTPSGTVPANNWFYGAAEQQLNRRDEYQDLEVNLIREQWACGCDSPWDIGWSMGIRYFRFQDQLTYTSIMPANFSPTLPNSAYMGDEVTNNLVGFQIGCDVAYNFSNYCKGLRLFLTPKVGIYNNFLDGTFQMQLGDHVTNGYSTYYSQYYPVHATGDVFSFLTQVDVGAEWQFTRNWSARVGFRALAVTGVGLAEDQFPQYICDMPQLQKVENPSYLVLYGAFLGVKCCF